MAEGWVFILCNALFFWGGGRGITPFSDFLQQLIIILCKFLCNLYPRWRAPYVSFIFNLVFLCISNYCKLI